MNSVKFYLSFLDIDVSYHTRSAVKNGGSCIFFKVLMDLVHPFIFLMELVWNLNEFLFYNFYEKTVKLCFNLACIFGELCMNMSYMDPNILRKIVLLNILWFFEKLYCMKLLWVFLKENIVWKLWILLKTIEKKILYDKLL